MVEELKVISEILGNLTEGALQGVIVYLLFSYLKPISIWAIASVTLIKMAKIIRGGNEKEVTVVSIDEIQDL